MSCWLQASNATKRENAPLVAVDHPWDAEAIDQHAESSRPEGLLKRQVDLPVLRQGVEDALAVCRIGDSDRHVDTLWRGVVRRGASEPITTLPPTASVTYDLVRQSAPTWSFIGDRRRWFKIVPPKVFA